MRAGLTIVLQAQAMSGFAQAPMTSDEFVAWAMQQPEGTRYELVGGRVVRMASERAAHARTKLRIARLLQDAVETRRLGGEVFGDGMSGEIDPTTVYEPDALLRCGPPLEDDAVKVTDPVIVVEVVSPGTASVDAGAKLADYFRVLTVSHHLIVRTKDQAVIRHGRAEDGGILTRIVRDGVIELDPPGTVLAGLFE